MTDASIAAAVLAGGHGKRLGQDKAAVVLEGRSLARWSVDALRGRCANVALVLRANQEPPADAGDAAILRDRVPDAGPLGGLQAALGWLPGEWLVLASCDQPFVVPTLIDELLAACDEAGDAVAGRNAGLVEPLPGLYRRTALTAVDAVLSRGNNSLQELLSALAVNYVDERALRRADPELRSYVNVNTPDDLARARALAAEL